MQKKLLLIILDGWGLGQLNEHNAVYLARTPFFDQCWFKEGGNGLKFVSTAILEASGKAVGLQPGQMGSSEVGHMHIGAGRVILPELSKVNQSLAQGDFFKKAAFLDTCSYVKGQSSKLHLVGILSDGGIHSSLDHLRALLKVARKQRVERIYLHAFLDGRDTPPASALKYLPTLEITPATICGRYYLDRDNNWSLTQKAVDLLTGGEGKQFKSYREAIQASYQNKIFDEFVEPVLLDKQGLICQNDAIICYNFRADRMRQLVIKLLEKFPSLWVVSMIDYGIRQVKRVVYEREVPVNYLGEILAGHKIKCLKITETQKYPHLTYFFNGTREEPYPGEERILIPSLKVKDFAEAPEMSAPEITNKVLANLDRHPVILVNFANGDMVGHTGVLAAGITACECVDRCLWRLCHVARQKQYQIIITADHGNVEEMYDIENDSVHTAHTTNPVPFILLTENQWRLKKQGSLVNIAPTVLQLLGVKEPKEMAGGSLIIFK